MNELSKVASNVVENAGSPTFESTFGEIDFSKADANRFGAALEKQMNNQAQKPSIKHQVRDHISLSDKIMGRTADLASELKKDQQFISRTLEQATRNADSMQLMKAMMALNDYQMRVQFISKTTSKATSSLDQLTKLQ